MRGAWRGLVRHTRSAQSTGGSVTRWANRATSLATGGDCQGRAHLAHSRGTETTEPSDQPGAVNGRDVIEADRGVVIEPFVRADDDLAGKVANGEVTGATRTVVSTSMASLRLRTTTGLRLSASLKR
jgi:hypothetical protein